MSTLQRLADRGLARPPRWLPGNVQYETIMGSVAYGVSSDTSDVSAYPAERNPMLFLTPYRGDLGLDAGIPTSVHAPVVSGTSPPG